MMKESRRLKRGKKENGFILILSGNAMTRSRQTYVAAFKQQQINYCNYVLIVLIVLIYLFFPFLAGWTSCSNR